MSNAGTYLDRPVGSSRVPRCSAVAQRVLANMVGAVMTCCLMADAGRFVPPNERSSTTDGSQWLLQPHVVCRCGMCWDIESRLRPAIVRDSEHVEIIFPQFEAPRPLQCRSSSAAANHVVSNSSSTGSRSLLRPVSRLLCTSLTSSCCQCFIQCLLDL
jgi:hypothetical protein